MTNKRFAVSVGAAFVISQVMALAVHGFILASDYAPYYGTLLRNFDSGPSWQALLLPVAHLAFVSALVWIYKHLGYGGSLLGQGLKLGALGWFVGQVPLLLIWYAEQPWPGPLVLKQLGLELISSLVIGLTIVSTAGQASRHATRLMSAPRNT